MSDTLREFLVSIGYEVDDASYKKFRKSLDDATGQATKLGTVAVATGNVVSAAFMKMARSTADAVVRLVSTMDDLYFTSIRTNTSVSGIQSLGFAAKQLGVSADAAASSLENLAHFQRNTPAWEDFMRGIRVETRDTNGELLKNDQILVNLGRRLSEMPTYLAASYASILGLDEKLMLALRSGEFERQMGKRNDMLKDSGVDTERLAASSSRLSKAWDGVKEKAALFGQAILSYVVGPLTTVVGWMDSFVQGLTQATHGIAGMLRFIGVNVKQYGDATGVPVGKVADAVTGGASIRNNNPGNMRNWDKSLPKDSRGFDQFGSPFQGYSGMAGQLMRYGDRGINTLSQIASKWAPASDGNNVPAYIQNLAKWTGFDPNQPLNLRDHETLRKLSEAITRQEHGAQAVGNRALIDSAVQDRLMRNATINQNNTYNVTGADPSSVAHAVSSRQSGLNDDLLRQTIQALR